MISLGGRHEQFFVVYNREGHINRIETFAQSLDKEGTGAYGGQWVSSDEFASFDNTIAHKFTIKCEDGFYTVYVDDVEIQEWKMDANSRVLVRNPETMLKDSNIMFSTNAGTTCTVSDVSVKSIEGKEDQVAKYVGRTITEENGNVTFNFPTVNWNDYDSTSGRLYTYGKVSDNCTITFDVKFNQTMSDAKFCIKLNGDKGRTLTICTNNSGTIHKSEIYNEWGGASIGTSVNDALHVKIEIVNGQATISFNDGAFTAPGAAIASNGILSFCAFNEKGAEVNNSVTLSNIVVTDTTPA